MASFDENGKYIKTNWKAGDKITATKLNKIEESIEAVNDNDISRHVEADARLDALEAKDVAHDKELTNIKNTIADNKAAAELGDYEINSRMTFLEDELNEGIEEVHNVASTVDGKIAQGKADMEAMVAEVEGELEGINSQLAHIEKKTDTFINVIEFEGDNKSFCDVFQDCINYCKNNNIKRIEFPNNDEYEINKTISIPIEIEEINFNGCKIIPSYGGNFTNGFMFNYNGNEHATDSQNWLGHKALKIKNLILSNNYGIENIKGIFSGAKLQVENIESYAMYCTIKYSLQYIDQNYIKNVIVWDHKGDDFAIDINSYDDFLSKGDNFYIENIEIGYLENFADTTSNFVRVKGGNNITIDKAIGGYYHFEDCIVDIKRAHIEHGTIKFINASFSIKDSYFQHNQLEKHPYCIAILTKNGRSNPCSLENIYFSYDYWSNVIYDRKIYQEIVISNDFSSPIYIRNINCGAYEFFGTKHAARIGIVDNNMNIVKNEMEFGNLISNDSVINSFGIISLPDNKHTIPSNDFITIEKKKIKNSTDKIVDGVLKEHFTTWKEETAKFTYHVSFVNSVTQRIGIKNTETFNVDMIKGEESSVSIKIKDNEIQNAKNGYLIIVRLMNDTEWRSIITIPIKDGGCEFIDDGYFIGFTPWYGIEQQDISYDWNNFYNTKIDANGTVKTFGNDKPLYGYWNKFDEVICTDDQKNVEKFVCVESGYPGIWRSVTLA